MLRLVDKQDVGGLVRRPAGWDRESKGSVARLER